MIKSIKSYLFKINLTKQWVAIILEPKVSTTKLKTGKKSNDQPSTKWWEAREESKHNFITLTWEMSSILKKKLKPIIREKAPPTGFKLSALTSPAQASVSVVHNKTSVFSPNLSQSFSTKSTDWTNNNPLSSYTTPWEDTLMLAN